MNECLEKSESESYGENCAKSKSVESDLRSSKVDTVPFEVGESVGFFGRERPVHLLENPKTMRFRICYVCEKTK